ncbi:HAD-IIA family hydrolase [Profundibacterium mesophilum]|uniref:4-nitrophenyl phosphatase n=1 Tax=Profundibacterium mesophilum KAUST100406-0324 TaxID=1037889 RepID=A0A921TBB0_9RHOB|nr:HAD hydrolase-like protein [Profundibacterium mesophilum]KAF0675240.1 4-nitrophenyl phosphatase [Profundibacterium mesophilum KAUST100406-0324]
MRHRLPAARFETPPRRSVTLEEVAADFDVILLDAYNVLNVGETPIPGAAARIAALRAAGRAVMVVSNAAGYPKPVMMARYAQPGFDFARREVVTSRKALLTHLDGHAPRRWGTMLDRTHGLEDFGARDITILGDDPASYANAEGLLLIGSGLWNATRQRLLEEALARHPRPVLVGNPDIVAPREGGLSQEPCHYEHRLADRTGITPVFLGKPFRGIYEIALSRLPAPCPPGRALMVGDTLHTDILGGRHMGFAAALVPVSARSSGLMWRRPSPGPRSCPTSSSSGSESTAADHAAASPAGHRPLQLA